MGSRRRGREAALQMLFQMDVSGVSSEQAVQSYWAHLGASREGEAFANDLLRGWASQRERIDGVKTLGRILEEILNDYDIERAQAEADLFAFAASLHAEGMVS